MSIPKKKLARVYRRAAEILETEGRVQGTLHRMKPGIPQTPANLAFTQKTLAAKLKKLHKNYCHCAVGAIALAAADEGLTKDPDCYVESEFDDDTPEPVRSPEVKALEAAAIKKVDPEHAWVSLVGYNDHVDNADIPRVLRTVARALEHGGKV